MSDTYSVILTTAGSEAEARTLGRGLVENQLVACAQLIPITSVFRWKGTIEEDSEVLLLLKARADLYEKIQNFILKHHSYDTPEVVLLPIAKGSATYLDWITAESLAS